jgi:hypothetical protein
MDRYFTWYKSCHLISYSISVFSTYNYGGFHFTKFLRKKEKFEKNGAVRCFNVWLRLVKLLLYELRNKAQSICVPEMRVKDEEGWILGLSL